MTTKGSQRKNRPNDNGHGPGKVMDNHFIMCTWNVRSLYRGVATQDLRRILTDYKAEIRWLGKGELMDKTTYHCDVYYSCAPKNRELGVGFALRGKPVNERLRFIRLKGRFYNISIICAHATH